MILCLIAEPLYITLHLIQTANITIDESVHELVKKLANGSLILYDLHRYRLYVPEQPLRIMQPRIIGKNKHKINKYTQYYYKNINILILNKSLREEQLYWSNFKKLCKHYKLYII